jgi:hypothetical protein
MAGLTRNLESGIYRIHFRYGGKQQHRSLKTTDEREAEARKGAIEITLLDLERGRLVIPPGADIWEFVKTDGKREKKPVWENALTLEGQPFQGQRLLRSAMSFEVATCSPFLYRRRGGGGFLGPRGVLR